MTSTASKRILIPGGSGQMGQILARYLYTAGYDVIVLSRRPQKQPWATVRWDGKTLDPAWTSLLEGAEAVIHLSGRTVDCRYTARNRRQILESRIQPTLLIGQAIERCENPPALWMNASTSTFYRHALDAPQDEFTGEPGGKEEGVPETWNFSIEVARRWEHAFYASTTPRTRKIALRSSMTMSPDPGGVFRVLLRLVRLGLGGTEGSGDQYVSWIHDHDFASAVDFLIRHPEISGPVNLTAPQPLPNREFLSALREAAGVRIGLPATRWMLEIGAFFLRTETELILKSRRAVPTVLLQHGFRFGFPSWPDAARDLVSRTRNTEQL